MFIFLLYYYDYSYDIIIYYYYDYIIIIITIIFIIVIIISIRIIHILTILLLSNDIFTLPNSLKYYSSTTLLKTHHSITLPKLFRNLPSEPYGHKRPTDGIPTSAYSALASSNTPISNTQQINICT
jgi:hypothetical protein